MIILFSNAAELSLWNKENYTSACMALFDKVKIAECIPTPIPWGPFVGFSQKEDYSVFIPDDDFMSSFASPEGEITHPKLKTSYEKFFKAANIPSEAAFDKLQYGLTNRKMEAELPDSLAIWITFNPDAPRSGPLAESFARYVEKGSGHIFNVETQELTEIKEKVVFDFKEIEGDIFDQKWNYLVHCANSFHTMGSGIAKAIKDKYPEAAEADERTPKDESKLGTFSYGQVGKSKFVVNLYGQSGIGSDGKPLNRNARYDAIYNGLYLLYEQIKNEDDNATVALPHGMASNLAGGEWPIVESIIESIARRFRINTIIVKKS